MPKAKQKQRTALELARALKRYTRMKPENAYDALADEWPVEIVALVEGVMWSEIPTAGRTVMDIARDTEALIDKAARASAAVQKLKRGRARSAARRKP